MTALIKTSPVNLTTAAAASMPACVLGQGGLRGNDFALAERCAR
jgi:hypothetical protein